MNEPNYRSALTRAGFCLSQRRDDPGQWYITCAPLGPLQPFGSVEEAVMYGIQLLISTLLGYQRASLRGGAALASEALLPFHVLPDQQLTVEQQAGARFVVPHALAHLRQHAQTGAWVVVTGKGWLGPFATAASAAAAAQVRGLVVAAE